MTSTLRMGTTSEGAPLVLPLDAVTQTIGIIARKGAGKTYTASVLAEELYKAGAQVVVIDPLDAWSGLRTSAERQESGAAVRAVRRARRRPAAAGVDGQTRGGARRARPVLLHPLARPPVEDRGALVRACERLFELRTGRPIHLIVDEADLFAPQRMERGAERTKGAVDDIVRRGRTRGLGVTLITQRPATIHKDVLTQIEVLVALQVTAPQDRKALEEWIRAHDVESRGDEFMASLASLAVGEAWIWSPSWLGVFARVQIRRRETYDSSSTPKVGAGPISAPRAAARPDLEALRAALADVVREADDNDPVKLRARVRQLERRLSDAEKKSAPEIDVEALSAAAAAARDREWERWLSARLNGAVRDVLSGLSAGLAEDLRALFDERPLPPVAPARPPVRGGGVAQRPPAAPTRSRAAALFRANERIPAGQAKVLRVLVQLGGRGTWKRVSILAGYPPSASTMRNIMGALKRKGLAHGSKSEGEIVVTPAGEAAAGDVEPLPTGDELRQHWLGVVPGGAPRAILQALIDCYPEPLSRTAIERLTGYPAAASTIRNAFGHLNSLELIEGRGDERRASRYLFEGGQ